MIVTDIDYPSGLPCALREGYDINHVQPFLRTDMESGRARQRRRFTSVPSVVDVRWIFKNDVHAAAFEAWFRDSLKDGVEWFNMPLKSPVGSQDYVCRFVEMYKGPTLTGRSAWRISARLEIYERPLMPEGWGEFPWFLTDASIFDVAMNDRWPEDRHDSD